MRNQDYFGCGNYQNISLYECPTGQEFLTTQEPKCKSDVENFSSRSRLSYTALYTKTVNLTYGYNKISDFNGYYVKNGAFLAWQRTPSKSGIIAVEPSCSSFISAYEVTSSGFTPLYSTRNCVFFANMIVSMDNEFGSVYSYSTSGNYTITLMYTNSISNFSYNQQVYVYEKLQNVTVIYGDDHSNCFTNVSCNFTLTPYVGYQVAYDWSSTAFENFSTSNNSIQIVFLDPGIHQVNLTAYDSFNQVFLTLFVNVMSYNVFLSLTAMNTLNSRVSTRNLSLLFTTSSSNYSCVLNIDYPIVFNQSIYANNSIINYVTSRDGFYDIKLNCSYPNYVNKYFNLSLNIENPIFGLDLLNSTVSLNQPARLAIAVRNGTNPTVKLWVNGILDLGFTFDVTSRLGFSSSLATLNLGTNNITLVAFNYVSNETLFRIFYGAYPIVNAELNCFTTSANSSILVTNPNNAFNFGNIVGCRLNMSRGSDVRMTIFYGDETSANSTGSLINLTGTWAAPYFINHSYAMPGSYNITICLENNVTSSIVIIKNIKLVSSASQLTAFVSPPKVSFDSTQGGIALFGFSFIGNSFGGSHSMVTYWSGDSVNVTIGPIDLKMNFILNKTDSILSYIYTATGNYTALFLVQNILGESKVYTINVEVVDTTISMGNLKVELVPAATLPFQTIQINVYLINGTVDTYTCFINNVFYQIFSRICKFLSTLLYRVFASFLHFSTNFFVNFQI